MYRFSRTSCTCRDTAHRRGRRTRTCVQAAGSSSGSRRACAIICATRRAARARVSRAPSTGRGEGRGRAGETWVRWFTFQTRKREPEPPKVLSASEVYTFHLNGFRKCLLSNTQDCGGLCKFATATTLLSPTFWCIEGISFCKPSKMRVLARSHQPFVLLRYDCPICCASVHGLNKLNAHLELKHGTAVVYRCRYCHQDFARKMVLASHETWCAKQRRAARVATDAAPDKQ